jgi:hypothetical protein
MKESYSEDLTSYSVPESYADGGDTVGVATAGVLAGKLLSSEIIISVCRRRPDVRKATWHLPLLVRQMSTRRSLRT